jgi:hypothetical protein
MLKYNLCIIYASGYLWGILHFLNNIGDHQELKVHLTYSLITEAGPFYTLKSSHTFTRLFHLRISPRQLI